MTPDDPLHLTADRAPFVMVPTWLLYGPASDGAVRLYGALHDAVAGREGPTRLITRQELADALNVSVDTIDRRMAELVKAGAVDKTEQHHAGAQVANRYHVRLTPRGGRKSAAGGPRSCPDGAAESRPLVEEQEEETPQPPAERGANRPVTESAASSVTDHRRSTGANPRALGTNPRGPRQPTADELAADARRQQRELEAQRAANPCPECDGLRMTEAGATGNWRACEACDGTGVNRRHLEVVR